MTDQAVYIRTESHPLGALSPFPGNAKRGMVGTILESLCRNGQYRSLIVRETPAGQLVVLAGNHTLQALAAHGPGPCGLTVRVGDTERPCAVCHGETWEPSARCEIVTCDDDTALRVNLVDNRSAELGEWDEQAVTDLLRPLGEDLGGTGWNAHDLEDLLTVLEEANHEPDDDDDGDQEQEAGVVPGPDAGARPAPADPVPGAPQTDGAPHLPPGHVQMILTYTSAYRDEAARHVVTARELAYPAEGAPEIVLHALRVLVAVLRHQDEPGRSVPAADLLAAAGIHEGQRP